MNTDSTNILKRIKLYLKIKTDTELARHFGVSTATVSKWKSRDSIDFNLLNEKLPNTADLNWLYRGMMEDDYIAELYKAEVGEYIEGQRALKENLEVYYNKVFELQDENKLLKSQIEILQDTLVKFTQSRQARADVQDLPSEKLVSKNRGKLVDS